MWLVLSSGNDSQTSLLWQFPFSHSALWSVLSSRNNSQTSLLWQFPFSHSALWSVLSSGSNSQTSLLWQFPFSHSSDNVILISATRDKRNEVQLQNHLWLYNTYIPKLAERLQVEFTVTSYLVDGPDWVLKKKVFFSGYQTRCLDVWSVIALLGRVSVHCAGLRKQVWSATYFLVWQLVVLSLEIRKSLLNEINIA